jgi:uroporphyrinogen-III synthase
MALIPAQVCVVITRLQAQAEVWAADLQQLGFASRYLPLLELRALSDEQQVRAIKNKILDYDLYQKVIFVSQNAVQYGMDWLDEYWPQLPIGIEYFAVGSTTAKKLASYGLRVTDLAVSESGGMTSEDLLQAPALQQVSGEKILIFRGCGGRGHLAQELRTRGATVDFCELYERLIPAVAGAQLQQLIIDLSAQQSAELPSTSQQQFIIALHSGESLQNLVTLAETLDKGQVSGLLKELPIMVPSARIADAAQAAGFNTIISAENATDHAMSAALLNYCRNA